MIKKERRLRLFKMDCLRKILAVIRRDRKRNTDIKEEEEEEEENLFAVVNIA